MTSAIAWRQPATLNANSSAACTALTFTTARSYLLPPRATAEYRCSTPPSTPRTDEILAARSLTSRGSRLISAGRPLQSRFAASAAVVWLDYPMPRCASGFVGPACEFGSYSKRRNRLGLFASQSPTALCKFRAIAKYRKRGARCFPGGSRKRGAGQLPCQACIISRTNRRVWLVPRAVSPAFK